MGGLVSSLLSIMIIHVHPNFIWGTAARFHRWNQLTKRQVQIQEGRLWLDTLLKTCIQMRKMTQDNLLPPSTCHQAFYFYRFRSPRFTLKQSQLQRPKLSPRPSAELRHDWTLAALFIMAVLKGAAAFSASKKPWGGFKHFILVSKWLFWASKWPILCFWHLFLLFLTILIVETRCLSSPN